MRVLTLLTPILLLAACGGSGGGSKAPDPPVDSVCSVTAQKQTTLDIARDWYLWNDRLPANININNFATVDDLVAFLTESSPTGSDGQPVDRFGGIGPAEAEEQFFGEGRFEGFGFSYRFETGDELRITRVFADSPAAAGGLARGQQIVALNGTPVADIIANDGLNALFALFDTSPLVFTLLPEVGDQFDTNPIERGIVTIDPVPRYRLIPRAGNTPVGYLEFYQFISTADAELGAVFAEFRANDVTDVIVDLRYNGGGLVLTAEFFGDLLGGRVAVAFDRVFTETRFNADRSGENTIRRFDDLLNSLNLSRLVFIASAGTASASELVINGLAPHVEVAIVGDTTFGKPIGQSGWQFCDNILRLTTFQMFNGAGYGDYFDGLPVTAGCEAPDDLGVGVGDDDDPNLVAALNYLGTGACQAAPAALFLRQAVPAELARRADHRGRPWRIYADAL
jgi:hypothetical protein